MKHIALETELKKRIRKQWLVEAVLCIVFLGITIGFSIAYEQSKVVEVIDLGFVKHESVSYNYDVAFGILTGALGLIFSALFLIGDCLFSKFSTKLATVEVGGDYITLYRGLLHINLYVNGELKDGLTVFGYYLEAPLSDRSKVTVSLGKWSARMSFSNGHPPIEL